MHKRGKSDFLLVIFVLLCDPLGIAAQVTNDKCLSCHEDYRKYLRTAHHLTSQPATANSIAGSFAPGKNTLRTSQRELHYRMEARLDGFFQTGVLGTPPDTISVDERFDLVIGSGRKGQTYLYWGKEDQLLQLPVSYWTEVASWVISPPGSAPRSATTGSRSIADTVTGRHGDAERANPSVTCLRIPVSPHLRVFLPGNGITGLGDPNPVIRELRVHPA